MLKRILISQLCSIILMTSIALAGTEQLHNEWSGLLATYVKEGKVDYQGFKQDEAQLDSYLARLNATDPEALNEQDRLALYINAYNAYTIKLILKNFSKGQPVKSIKKIGGLFSSPWSIRFADIGGKTLTLDEIEHDIIRPLFNDPRVHFAVNCASKSCPPLISEAYTGAMLNEQLEANTIDFLHNREFNNISGDTLYVSKIFKWFGEDFSGDITGFVKKYAQGELRAGIDAAGDKLKVSYLDYDWSINSQ